MPGESLEAIAAEVASEAAKDLETKATDTPTPEPSPTPEPENQPSKAFLEQYKAITGIDLSEKYANDEAAIKGLSEAYRLVGQKNEDAERWHKFNELAAGHEDEIANLLQGKAKPKEPVVPDPSPKAGDDWTPKSLDEMRYMAQKIFDDQGNVKAGVDPKLVDRYAAANQKLQDAAFELAFSPEKMREKLLGSVKKELLEETAKLSEEKLADLRRKAEIDSITEKYADKLFSDGQRDNDHLTPFGQQVLEELKEMAELYQEQNPEKQFKTTKRTYEKAISSVIARQPKPNPTKPTNPNAVHKPALAPAPDSEADLDERFRNGLDLTTLFLEKSGAK